MREILFRGKQTDNGEWVYGSLVVANDRINNGKHYILQSVSDFSYGDGESRVRIGCFDEVIPKTVGQYTGLTDKNGTKIFEGDIIKIYNGRRKCIVEVKFGEYYPTMFYELLDYYRPGTERLSAFGFYGRSARTDEELILLQSPFTTIIGNIHDNPEMPGGDDNAAD